MTAPSMTPNIEDGFRQAIVQAGLPAPDTIIADGRFHRFSTNGHHDDSGWYKLYPDGIAAGAFGDWRQDVKHTWCARSDQTMTAKERAESRERIAKIQREREDEELQRHKEARHRAIAMLQAAKDAGDHPYLERKHVRAYGLFIHADGRLLVPLCDIEDRPHSVQLLDADGDKRFLPGGRTKGLLHLIGTITDLLCVVEGYATGASIHEATNYPVAIAFCASNLLPVAQGLRHKYPAATVLICGDNDQSGVGQKAAHEAAESIKGVMAIPETVGEDWNDVHGRLGLEAVKHGIETMLPPPDEAQPAPGAFAIVTPSDSFVSRYVRYAASRTDAPLEAHEGLAFAVLSALASAVRLPIATAVRGWQLTLWVLYLVNTTTGRKSTTLDLAVDMIKSLLGEAALLSWEGSPQGFIQRLQERDGQATVFVRDEYASLLTAINRGGHLTGLPQVLIKAYDGSTIELVRTKKRNSDGAKVADTDRADAPYLVQCAAAPWDAFVRSATIDNVQDGFLPRFIITTGQAAGRPLQPITPSIKAQRESLLAQLRTYQAQAQTIEVVAFAPGVLEAQWAFEQTLLARASDSSRPEAAGPVLKRLADTALKLTALLAIEQSTGTVLTLTLAQFETAATITARWADNALRLVDVLGRTTFLKHCEEVL